jgi:hypothetical protein
VPTAAFELRVADEVVNVRFDDHEPVVEAGPSADPDVIVIETDPATLFCVAARQQSTREAIDAGAVRITGKRADAEQFLSFFTFDEPSRQLEHV